jgi:hypothetical protein
MMLVKLFDRLVNISKLSWNEATDPIAVNFLTHYFFFFSSAFTYDYQRKVISVWSKVIGLLKGLEGGM